MGKGIYDVDAFMRTLQDRVPDNSLLSHDLFEGIHGRAALVSDIVLYEDYPAGYLAQSRRQHRWIRGDWQLLPWLGATVPSRTGGRTANVLSVLDRWKIVDNLRRSLLWPAVLLLLISGWLWLPGSPLFWSVLALAPLLMPPATGLLVWIVTWVRHRPGSGLFQELRYPFTRALLGIVFLPHTAYVALDAIARTLVRVYRTRRHLLEWTTAAQTARRLRRRTERGVTWLQMAETPLFALLLGGLLLRQAPAHLLPAAPFLLAWMLAPWIAGRISRAPAPMSPALSQSERQRLRNLALRTWLYFEHHVDPDDNWLPPDHYQESPLGVVAHRTSPTNIGLMLLATIAAYDFGYESVLSIAIRLQNSFETLDQLERRRGHFLNWYETRSLEPLPPRYISMVDSGNLAGCLVALQQSMVEIREQPILRWARWQGLCDSMSSLVDLLDEMGIRSAQEYTELRRTLTALIDEIEAAEHIQGQWIPTMLRINEYKMPELAGNLQTILAVHGHHVRPAHLHTLRILLNRINFQLNDMQRECERLAPWLQRFIQIPLLVRNYIKQDPSLQAEWDALQAHLGPSLSLAATPDACEQATPIAHTLRTQLLAVAEESEQATIARWCDELLAALESAPVAGRQVVQTLMDVERRSEAYVEEMDFSVLYSAKRDVFHIGFNVDTGTLDNNYYDLLASEARLGSFLAIAKHDIPVKHWLHLGRPLSAAESGRALLSWSGTMFEYLMPNLFMRLPKNTLLRRACDVAVAQQIDYGRKQNCPWGISESGYYHFDANRYYQYQAFGVPGLGFKRGLGEDLVVSSYASILALRLNPHAVVENLGRLTDMGMLGDYGLYEAVDYTAERLPPATDRAIVRSYMVHHQGMILLELLNYLEDDLMVDRFHSDPRVQNVEMLLHEQIPHAVPLEELGRESEAPQPALDPRISAEPWHLPAKTPTPQAHYLSNGGYSVLVTNGGGGFSRWHETDLTRWRADATLDDWGNWLYLRDETTGELWSMTVRPVADQRTDHAVHFAPHYAGFQSRRDSLAARMEIFVVPGDDVEIRRVRLSNQGDETRRLTLTSYAEVVLNDQRSDRRHPAFNKMFIESEHDAETDVLLFRRRPRSADEDPIFLAHGLALNGSLTRNGGYETDRARFLGRNGTVRSPQALTHAQGDLTGTTGATLDPIMAFSQRLDIGPNESVELAYLTAAASTREDARFLLHQYQRWTAIRRAEMESKSAAELEMRRLNMTSDALAQVQRLLSPLLYPSSAMRAPAATLAANRLGQPALWPLAISGDYPILLLRLQDDEGLALLQQVLRAHRYWRTRHLQISLVILNDEASGYVQELQGQVAHQIRRSDHSNYLNQRGGIFLLHRENLDEEALTLLESAARVVLDQKEGSLDAQLAQLDAHRTPLPLFEPSGNGGDELTVPPLSRPVDLRFDNGFGGFSPDGREYVIYRRPDQPTPAPWSNVIANPEFGFLMTERGSSFTWAVNSGENRLTPWSNDPVSDPSGEALYLRDEETGALWSPLPAPAGDDKPYLIRHGAGYSRFEHHSQGLIQTTTTFVPIDAPVKIVTLQLKNCASRVRRITATYYAEWVLGVNRDEMQQHIVPDYDNDTGALLARNAYHTEFGTRVAFLGASRPPHGVTTDRAEFLGRQGDYSRPDALTRMGLSGTVRAGVDPCAAYQVHLDIQPDEEVEVHFLLGQGGDRAAVQELLARYRDPAAVRSAWDDMTNFWDETLETVQVKTPDPALDLLLNRWLLYQNLACRVWGRSAFYQSSGAFGFRDQLQDVMALVHARPALARAHLLTAAAHQFETGDVLHWWHPPSGRGVRTRITDDLLWLPYVTAYYVERTGDLGVLDESIPFLTGSPLTFEEHERYDHYQSADAGGSLYEHCLRAIQRGSTAGKHGLPLMGGGDWNDGMNRVGIGGQGESVWLAWFLARTLTMFAPLCEHKDDAARAARFREDAADLQAAADEGAWDGAWYLRGFYDDGTPLGASTSRECRIDSIAQSWAVFASDPVTDRAHTAMQAVAEQLVDEENELIRLFRPPFDQTTRDPGYIKGYPPGIRENGGQYTHAALWTIWAFAELGDGARATDLFRLINPIHHGGDSTRITNYRVEPYVVAADVYADSGHEGRGGWSWYTGSAGWMYRLGIEGILGVQRMGDRLRIAPCISPDWPELTVTLRCGAGTTYCIHIRNPDGVSRGVREITVDGAKQETGIVPLIDDGTRHAVRVLLGSSPRKEGHDEGSRQ